jgi:hypothetical protein
MGSSGLSSMVVRSTQHEDAIEVLLLLGLVGIDREVLVAERLQVAAEAGVADQRLVARSEPMPSAARIEARSAASFSAS